MTIERTELPLPEDTVRTILSFLSPRDKAAFRAVSRASHAAGQLENMAVTDMERQLREACPSLPLSVIEARIQCYQEMMNSARGIARRELLLVDVEKMSDELFLSKTLVALCAHPNIHSDFLEVACILFPKLHRQKPFDVEKTTVTETEVYLGEHPIDISHLIKINRGPNTIRFAIERTELMLEAQNKLLQKFQRVQQDYHDAIASKEAEVDEAKRMLQDSEQYLRESSIMDKTVSMKPHQSLEVKMHYADRDFASKTLAPVKNQLKTLEAEFTELRLNSKRYKESLKLLRDAMQQRVDFIHPDRVFEALVSKIIEKQDIHLLETTQDFFKHQTFVLSDSLLRTILLKASAPLFLAITKKMIGLIPEMLRVSLNNDSEGIIERRQCLIDLYPADWPREDDKMHALFLACLDEKVRHRSMASFRIMAPFFRKAQYQFTAEEIYQLEHVCNASEYCELHTQNGFKFPENALKHYFASVSLDTLRDKSAWTYISEQEGVDLHGCIDSAFLDKCRDPHRYFLKHMIEMLIQRGATVSDEATLNRMIGLDLLDGYTRALLLYCIRREVIQHEGQLTEEARGLRQQALLMELQEGDVPYTLSHIHIAFMNKLSIPYPRDVLDRLTDGGYDLSVLKAICADGAYRMSSFRSMATLLWRYSAGLTWDDILPTLDREAMVIEAHDVHMIMTYGLSRLFTNLSTETFKYRVNQDMLNLLAAPEIPEAFFDKVVDAIDGSLTSFDPTEVIQKLAPQAQGGEKFYAIWLKILSLRFQGHRIDTYKNWDDLIAIALHHQSETSMIQALRRMGAPLPKQEKFFKWMGIPSGENIIKPDVVSLILEEMVITDIETRQMLVRWMLQNSFSAPQIIRFATSREDWPIDSVQDVLIYYPPKDLNVDILLHHLYHERVQKTGDPLTLLTLAISHQVNSETLKEFFQLFDPKGFQQWGRAIPINSMTFTNAAKAYRDDPAELEAVQRVLRELQEEGAREQLRLRGFWAPVQAPRQTGAIEPETSPDFEI